MLRTFFGLMIVLGLMAPALAGSQVAVSKFQRLSDELLAVAPNNPRTRLQSKTFIVKLSSTMVLAIMEGYRDGEPDYASFMERVVDAWVTTDISLDGKLWRRYNVVPSFHLDENLSQKAWVMGWAIAGKVDQVGFDTVNPKRLTRWSNLMQQAIALRKAGQTGDALLSLLVVKTNWNKIGLVAWQRQNGSQPSQVIVAQSDRQALAIVRTFLRKHPSGPVLAVGFDNLGTK